MRPTRSTVTAESGNTPEQTRLEALLRFDRFIVIAGLAIVIAAAWVWILFGAGVDDQTTMDMPQQQMAGMSSHSMSDMSMVMTPAVWTLGYAILIFTMWWIMMVAMMLPSATPMLLLFARVNRKEKSGGRPYVPTAVFAAGYLTAWGAFSITAAGVQWMLVQLGWLSGVMATTSTRLGGVILIAAGAWQLTPIKHVCLRHCRSPLSFLVGSWRPGRRGAFRMGLEHGTYCLGCCWFLMGLLLFGGVMNLYWVAGLAAYVLIEKTVPMGQWLARITGAGLVAWGALLLTTAF
jgi:predicted metal-binding membrane protein